MKHRGKQASDDKHFSPKWQAALAEAAEDLAFLLGKQYGHKSSLALVGSRYKLNARQQRALSLMTCPSDKLTERQRKALSASELDNQHLAIDGFNLLISIEAMLSGGFILVGQDGCHRDLSSIHGSYKKVAETQDAIALIDCTLKSLHIAQATWYFDQPVSNSGMLKTLLYDYASQNDSPWTIELVMNPDKELVERSKVGDIIVSCDSWIIDQCHAYIDLAGMIANRLNALNEMENLALLDFSI